MTNEGQKPSDTLVLFPPFLVSIRQDCSHPPSTFWMLLSRRLWFADAGSASVESWGKLNGKLLKSSDSSSEKNQSTCKYKIHHMLHDQIMSQEIHTKYCRTLTRNSHKILRDTYTEFTQNTAGHLHGIHTKYCGTLTTRNHKICRIINICCTKIHTPIS